MKVAVRLQAASVGTPIHHDMMLVEANVIVEAQAISNDIQAEAMAPGMIGTEAAVWATQKEELLAAADSVSDALHLLEVEEQESAVQCPLG